MVKTAIVPAKKVRRSYRKRTKAGLPLYPSLYDSNVFYLSYSSNLALQQGVACNWSSRFYPTSMIENATNFVNLRGYFNRYRVETLTVELMIADGTANVFWNALEMASLHNGIGWTNASVDVNFMDSMRDQKEYAPGAMNRFVHKWKMDPDIQAETEFRDIPPGLVNVPVNYVGGVLWLFKTTAALAPFTVAYAGSVNVKWKIRVVGRSAVSAGIQNNNLPV